MLKQVIFQVTTTDEEAEYLDSLIQALCTKGIHVFQGNDSKHIIASNQRMSESLLVTDSPALLSSLASLPPSEAPVCIGYGASALSDPCFHSCALLLESFDSVDVKDLELAYAHAKGESAVIAETSRLTIRESTKASFTEYYALRSLPAIDSFLSENLADYDTEFSKRLAYIKNYYPFCPLAVWDIINKEDGTYLGQIGFSEDETDPDCYYVGYFIAPNRQNRGYATEALRAVLDYAASLEVDSVKIRIFKQNAASLRVLSKCGYPYHLVSTLPEELIYCIELN